MPMRLRRPMPVLPPASNRRPLQSKAARRWTGLAYAMVLLAALCSAWLQPGVAEAPPHDTALLSLASWAAGGLADGDPPTPAPTAKRPH